MKAKGSIQDLQTVLRDAVPCLLPGLIHIICLYTKDPIGEWWNSHFTEPVVDWNNVCDVLISEFSINENDAEWICTEVFAKSSLLSILSPSSTSSTGKITPMIIDGVKKNSLSLESMRNVTNAFGGWDKDTVARIQSSLFQAWDDKCDVIEFYYGVISRERAQEQCSSPGQFILRLSSSQQQLCLTYGDKQTRLMKNLFLRCHYIDGMWMWMGGKNTPNSENNNSGNVQHKTLRECILAVGGENLQQPILEIQSEFRFAFDNNPQGLVRNRGGNKEHPRSYYRYRAVQRQAQRRQAQKLQAQQLSSNIS